MANISQLDTDVSDLFFKPLTRVYASTEAQYAADGHYQKAACFDPKPTKEGESQIATGHFFRLNLRHDHLDYLDLSRPGDGKKKDHDMRLIKRLDVKDLRNGAKVGRKVLYAWDKACIDYGYWETLKRRAVYFVTEEKRNSAARQISTDITDRSDPRNEGVVSDYYVGRDNGPQLRRVDLSGGSVWHFTARSPGVKRWPGWR